MFHTRCLSRAFQSGFSGLAENDLALLKGMLNTIGPIHYSSLYQHQIDSIKLAISEKKNYVVTTGTGSGKSYCFQIPVLLSILKESLGLLSGPRWDESQESGTTWWRESRGPYVPKRLCPDSSHRKPAIRALLMYPLNALVQDQIDGLRGILSSQEASRFYNSSLGGDRIYFGQYKGTTLGRGSARINANKIKPELREIENTANRVPDDKRFCVPSLDGSELITRWDMQATAPDILITNYSMLSIMLTRDAERKMLDQTRDWLYKGVSQENWAFSGRSSAPDYCDFSFTFS